MRCWAFTPGDALGATVEFSSWTSIRHRYPDGLRDIAGGGPFGWSPGDAADDTDLTRAVLLAYLSPGGDVVRAAADNMVAWLRGDWPGRRPGTEPRDVGDATRAGLVRYLQIGDARASGAGMSRAGNGSLMRCIPTALVVTDQSRRIRESMDISAIIHDDPRCTVACAAYNEIAAAAGRCRRRNTPQPVTYCVSRGNPASGLGRPLCRLPRSGAGLTTG